MAVGKEVLIIGYGNPGRLDDGLGPALIEALEKKHLPDVELEADYQLTVEHSAHVSGCKLVVFADASRNGAEPYELRRIEPLPSDTLTFSSHSVSAEEVLALSRNLFGVTPEARLLSIRGYEFDAFKEGLSAAAQNNLAAALQAMEELLESYHGFSTEPAAAVLR